MKENCKNCKFWLGYTGDRKMQGECHRYPPVDNESPWGSDIIAIWVETNELNWCGEFKERNES